MSSDLLHLALVQASPNTVVLVEQIDRLRRADELARLTGSAARPAEGSSGTGTASRRKVDGDKWAGVADGAGSQPAPGVDHMSYNRLDHPADEVRVGHPVLPSDSVLGAGIGVFEDVGGQAGMDDIKWSEVGGHRHAAHICGNVVIPISSDELADDHFART